MEWRFCFGNDFLKQICPRPASFAERTTRPLDVRELAAKASPCLRKVRFGCRNRFFSTSTGSINTDPLSFTLVDLVLETHGNHITMPFVGKSRMPVLKNKENYYLMAL